MKTVTKVEVTKNGKHNGVEYRIGDVFDTFDIIAGGRAVEVYKGGVKFVLYYFKWSDSTSECKFIEVPVIEQNNSYSIF